MAHPGSPRPKKIRQEPSRVKVMIIVAYNIDGVILHHVVPVGHTVNAKYYRPFLEYHLRLVVQ
jgi:hypothetical protein